MCKTAHPELRADLAIGAQADGPDFGRRRGRIRLETPHQDRLIRSNQSVSAGLCVYERFAPQDADGVADPRGPREIVVGTGGCPLCRRAHFQANSELLDTDTWGVLTLTLKSASYAWEFVPAAGKSVRDSGAGTCTGRPSD